MARRSWYGEKKLAVLALIHDAALRHGRAPTVRDLAAQVDVGLATMHSYLERLAAEGLVEWQPRSHRSIRCTPRGTQALQSPEESPT